MTFGIISDRFLLSWVSLVSVATDVGIVCLFFPLWRVGDDWHKALPVRKKSIAIQSAIQLAERKKPCIKEKENL